MPRRCQNRTHTGKSTNTTEVISVVQTSKQHGHGQPSEGASTLLKASLKYDELAGLYLRDATIISLVSRLYHDNQLEEKDVIFSQVHC